MAPFRLPTGEVSQPGGKCEKSSRKRSAAGARPAQASHSTSAVRPRLRALTTCRAKAGTGRCEKIGSAAGRVARNGNSWWRRFGVSPCFNAGTDETFSRRICAEMFRLSPHCPERPIRMASLRSHHSGLSRIRADAVAFPIFSHVPGNQFRKCREISPSPSFCGLRSSATELRQKDLKLKAYPQLQAARQVRGRAGRGARRLQRIADLPERGAGHLQVWAAEERVIEDVVRHRAQVQFQTFAQIEALLQRRVEAEYPGSVHGADSCCTELPDRPRLRGVDKSRQLISCDIEPTLRVLITDGAIGYAIGAFGGGAARSRAIVRRDGQRQTALPGAQTRKHPPAEK